MKKTIVLIVLILIFSVSTVGNVRAQGNTVSAVGNWHPGDAHVHSLHSLDGHRTISDIARDAADFGLDWIIMTDHSYDMDATEWQQAWDECEQAEADTGLVVMCGEELSVDEYEDDWPSDTGHYLCYGLSTFIANTGTWMWPDEPDAQDAIDEVNNQGGVGFIAHPNETTWDWNNFAVTGYTGIEVWNGEWNDADQYALELWDRLLVQGLASGRHITGIGNSDAHPWGTYVPPVWTYLYLPSLTPEAIVDAYRGGHAIFTNGPFLSFEIGEHIVGDTVRMTKGSWITLDISWDPAGHEDIDYVNIYKGTSAGAYLYDIMFTSEGSGSDSWMDPMPAEEPCYYRLEGRSFDNPSTRVYTNPIWIIPIDDLTEAIVVNTDTVVWVSRSGDDRAFHVFSSPVGFLSATHGDTFLIMSTGIAANIQGSPEDFESTDFGPVGPAGDTASLTFKFLVPSGATTLSFDFRFMSEEYPEWVGTVYNDFFYAYLTDSTGTHQVAFDDNGNIINVNNNFFNPNIYPIGTVFDGSTKRLTTTVNVNEGEVITLQFMVGDAGDGIYDTAVFLDNVRFNVEPEPPGTTPTADVIVIKTAPNNVEQGKQFTYTINYFNIEEGVAKDVVVTDILPPEVTFVSASAGGIYTPPSQQYLAYVKWNLGTIQPFSSGTLTLTVSVPNDIPIGTLLFNVVHISTTSQESGSVSNNQFYKETTVVGSSSLPPNVDVGPTVSNYNGIPVLYWTTPTTFTYHGDATVIGVDINIHLPDGGPDIGGPMTNIPGTYDWAFTYTFYPRHGQGIVTYTVHYADGQQSTISHSILVDPSGYVYNAVTGERIQGATVTLYRFDIVLQQFVLVAPDDPGIEPHINPQITDENGGYGWMVSPGIYMVKAEKAGYAPNSVIVTVPPPATDLNIPLTPIDSTPPTTQLLIGEPHYTDASGNTYVTSATSFTLVADDGPDGSGVAATYYRQYNATYDSNWKEQPNPFYMTGLDDGEYSIDYYSTDVAGNVEPTNTATVILDNTGPSIAILNPPIGWALQDGVTFIASATDLSGTCSLNFSIREANGDQGTPVGFEDIPAIYNTITGKWELSFNTLQLPDGFYILLVNAQDNLGNTALITVPYSIRNWAILELLPATPNNKAGRTMPVKFALRVAASVDPNQPFVYNEELTIKIYATDNPSNILQTSTFGDTARDYRINTISEHYITNFQTLKTPKTYVVEVWRKDMLIGSFNFKTVK